MAYLLSCPGTWQEKLQCLSTVACGMAHTAEDKHNGGHFASVHYQMQTKKYVILSLKLLICTHTHTDIVAV